MRRWFRRKEKHQAESPEEQQAPPQDETGAGPEPDSEAGAVPPASPGASPSTTATAPEPEDFEPSAPGSAALEAAAPEPEDGPRPGFWGRLFKGVEESELEASCSEALIRQKAAQEAAPEEFQETAPQPSEVEPVPEPELPPAAAEAEGSLQPASTAPEETEELAAEAAEPRKGMFRRFRERLSRTRENLAGGLDRLFAGRKEVDAALLEELEELLITADLGVETTLFLVAKLEEKLRRRELGDLERLKQALREEMVALLAAPRRPPLRNAFLHG